MIKRIATMVRRPRRGALAVAGSLFACLLPVAAHALGPGCQLDPKQAGNYTQDMGTQAAPGQFAPSRLPILPYCRQWHAAGLPCGSRHEAS